MGRRQFPIATLDGDVPDGEFLPDAYVHDSSLLPHLHGDFEAIFPRARALSLIHI